MAPRDAHRSTWEWHPRDRVRGDACIPRKEVIQPHLPVRLPCYDFTPVTDPTLDSLPPFEDGLAHRLQVLPASMV